MPVQPKTSRQTAAKGLVSQLDARIGPKAAATTSTVTTVGDGLGKAKLQKEHALGHSSNFFCLCVLVEDGRPARLAPGLCPTGGTPVLHDHTNLVNYTYRYHEAQIFKTDPLQLAQQPTVHPLSRRRMGSAAARRPRSVRIPHSRRCPGRSELGHGPAETRELSRRLRRL